MNLIAQKIKHMREERNKKNVLGFTITGALIGFIEKTVRFWRRITAANLLVGYRLDILKQKFYFRFDIFFKKKLVFVDVGELGWSLYLSGHIQWLKKYYSDEHIIVFTACHRKVLFEGADETRDIPAEFYSKYSACPQMCFGLLENIRKLVGNRELRIFFRQYFPEDYRIPNYFDFKNSWITKNKVLFQPYRVKNKYPFKNILVFPRCRLSQPHHKRNLPQEFYEKLILALCSEFPRHMVISVGSLNGAYTINLGNPNYKNCVGENTSVQDVIDFCPMSLGAVGGASSLPKISLLQGVPTYVIGHEKERVVRTENWRGIKVSFWEIPHEGYATFNSKECIRDVVNFFKENQKLQEK
jgi:hypothetical protein